MADSFEDRREHPRFDTQLQVQASPQDGGTIGRMVASNLSLGGLYCTSAQDFPEMTRLAVRLMLPTGLSNNGDAHPVDLEAVVVRRRRLNGTSGEERYELGLFFTGISGEVRRQIAQYIESAKL